MSPTCEAFLNKMARMSWYGYPSQLEVSPRYPRDDYVEPVVMCNISCPMLHLRYARCLPDALERLHLTMTGYAIQICTCIAMARDPDKLPPPVRQWIVSYCQEHPHTTSRVLQPFLREQCDVIVSLGYLNQVRAALGVGYVPPPQEKKR
jgi:hypothetical protein